MGKYDDSVAWVNPSWALLVFLVVAAVAGAAVWAAWGAWRVVSWPFRRPTRG